MRRIAKLKYSTGILTKVDDTHTSFKPLGSYEQTIELPSLTDHERFTLQQAQKILQDAEPPTFWQRLFRRKR